ncbi:MAG: flagellar basal-body rod protein FlgG [Candidatus Saganbacteria bacterium]|nr:flagellar basal-body rod protein FlgG [Candidatus Saganbacteria bacterium]
MFQPLYIAATGMNAFEEQMVDITNNLSNARTVGFKRGTTEMESLFYLERAFQKRLEEEMMQGEAARPFPPVEFGTGVRVAATPKDFSQGTIEITSNPLDLAIKGEGFFQLHAQDGSIVYSRAGNFHVDNEGNVVDPNGNRLEPVIKIPEGATGVIIRRDGTMLVQINNSIEQTEIGQIALARFTNPAGLKSIGLNLFEATTASGEPSIGVAGEEGIGDISQFSLEGSNVDVISEMMRMVMAQRVFDSVSKAVQAYDGMMDAVIRMKA